MQKLLLKFLSQKNTLHLCCTQKKTPLRTERIRNKQKKGEGGVEKKKRVETSFVRNTLHNYVKTKGMMCGPQRSLSYQKCLDNLLYGGNAHFATQNTVHLSGGFAMLGSDNSAECEQKKLWSETLPFFASSVVGNLYSKE